jgi:LacI family fructose operon transcriptional repressor
LAGVSVTTASYVLNGKGDALRISPATIKRVHELAEHYGYRPNAQAVGLRLSHTRTLGFILPDLEIPSYARMAKVLERAARKHGYQMLMVCSEDDPANEKALAEMLQARRCDGLVVISCLADNDAPYRQARGDGCPVVAVDRQLDPAAFVSVVSDDENASRLLAQALLTPPPKTIGYIGARHELAISQAREKGFLDATMPYADSRIVVHGQAFSREDGRSQMQALLAAPRGLPDALLTSSYVLMTGVLDVLADTSPDWSERIRLATFGDAQLLDFLPVRVDAMIQQHEQIADIALRCLVDAIEHYRYEPAVHLVPRVFMQRRQ